MKYVKISLKVNEYLIQTDAKFLNNIFYFKDNNDDSDITFDLDNLIFIRDTKEYTYKLDFNNTNKINYYLKNYDKTFYMNFTLKQLLKYNKEVIIKYQVEGNDFDFKFNYTEE